jgi:hypothetical protein
VEDLLLEIEDILEEQRKEKQKKLASNLREAYEIARWERNNENNN